jgi:hypothetical protein
MRRFIAIADDLTVALAAALTAVLLVCVALCVPSLDPLAALAAKPSGSGAQA